MKKASSTLTLAALTGVILALSACDPAEQDRITRYEKGVYLGKPDTALKEDQVRALRQRANQQGG